MKSLITNIFKTLFFFDLSIIVISLIPNIEFAKPAVTALWQQGIPMAVIIAFTVFYIIVIEKRKIELPIKKTIKNFLLGILFGLFLPIVCVTAAALLKGFDILGINKISDMHYWILALLFNAVGSELLFRGYLFTLYKKHYGCIAATAISTLFYLSLNLELISKDKIYLLNILLLNILLCVLMKFTDSLASTISAHFTYLLCSTFMFGSLPLTGGFPSLFSCTFGGKKIISGGEYGIEGSIIMLVVSVSLTALLLCLRKGKKFKFSLQKRKADIK